MKGNKTRRLSESEAVMNIISGLGLFGLVAVFVVMGIMACLAFGSDVSAGEQTQQIPATSKSSGSTAQKKGTASFEADEIKVQVEIGMSDGRVAAGEYAPVHLQLENSGEDFDGYFCIYPTTADNSGAMFKKRVSIAAGETKKIDMFFSAPAAAAYLSVALCDKEGDVIKSKQTLLESFNNQSQDAAKTLAVMSENPDKLGYFSGSDFALHELTKDTLMDDVRGLKMIDVLLINDFDTQTFSEKQIAAITQWVQDGGVLVLGTGAQAEKTLKAFSGNLLKGTIGSTSTIKTRFGNDAGKADELKKQLENDLHREKIDTVRQFLSENLSTDMYNQYFEDMQMMDYTGSWKSTILNPSGEIYRELSSTFSDEELEKVFDVSITDEELKKLEQSLPTSDLTKDITTLTIENAKSLLTQDKEQLISRLEYGSGHIIVAEFDFSLENNYWTGYGAILKALLARNCDTDRTDYMGLDDTEWYGTNYMSDGLRINEVSGLPNMGLYMILLLLYVAFVGPVAYVVLRRRDKRHLLWGIIPVAAVLCSVMIYLIGTTTRIQKPYINYLSQLIMQEDGMAQLDTAFSITSPNNKSYQVKVEGNQDIRPYYTNAWYVSPPNNGNQSLSYDYSIEYANDSTTLHMDNIAAFGSSKLRNTQKVEQKERLEFSSLNLTSSSFSGIVTNHLPYDLEDCLIVYSGDIIRLGKIAKGESISLDKLKKSQYSMSSSGNDWESLVRTVFTGEPYGETRDTHKARRIQMLCYYGQLFTNGGYLTSGTTHMPEVYFYGFRADKAETAFTELFNLDEYGETAILQEITAEDMMADGEVNLGFLSEYETDSTGWTAMDSTGRNIIAADKNGEYKADIEVVYNLKEALAKNKKGSLKAKYSAVSNAEFRAYELMDYVNGDIFMGTISVVDAKTGKSIEWAKSPTESELENLEKYMDKAGNLTMRYHIQSDKSMEGMFDGVSLPVIRITAK